MGCRAVVIAVAVAGAGCGPASPQSAPAADTATTASPKPLTLETASCAVETAAELPGEDVIREGRAVRIAGVWFLSSETHAMPDSYCEDGEPEVSTAEALGLQCSGDLTEAGQFDHEAGAPGISDDPLERTRGWIVT